MHDWNILTLVSNLIMYRLSIYSTTCRITLPVVDVFLDMYDHLCEYNLHFVENIYQWWNNQWLVQHSLLLGSTFCRNNLQFVDMSDWRPLVQCWGHSCMYFNRRIVNCIDGLSIVIYDSSNAWPWSGSEWCLQSTKCRNNPRYVDISTVRQIYRRVVEVWFLPV